MAKIHLRRNKAENGQAVIALCATRPEIAASANGYIARNGRLSYQFMASEIVGPSEFREVGLADRCAHCMKAGLIMKNRQRKAKGLDPVDTF